MGVDPADDFIANNIIAPSLYVVSLKQFILINASCQDSESRPRYEEGSL